MTTNKPKIYIVEDMAISRAALIDILEEAGFEIIGSAANADVGWQDLQVKNPDLILLDINLAGKNNGIWLGQKIRENLKMAIVFLTAYGDSNTLDKVSALKPNGYIMKPYNTPTLLTTINIALNQFNNVEILDENESNEFIIVDQAHQKVKIYLSDIQYIASEGNYLEIYLENKTIICRDKLKKFMENLSESSFIKQIHLRFAININYVQSAAINHVIINNKLLPISKTYQMVIKNYFC